MNVDRALHSIACDAEQRLLIDTIEDLGRQRIARAADDDTPHRRAARRELVDLGLWALGVPESAGGGGADPTTVSLVIAAISGAWPALGLAIAHAHAAAVVLAQDPDGREVLGEVVGRGRAVALVDAAGDAVHHDPDRDVFEVVRVEVGDHRPDLLVLLDEATVALVPGDDVRFEDGGARTGLEGAVALSASFELTSRTPRWGADVAVARRTLYHGLTSVAAGIADAAARNARHYAARRWQFGGPLTNLPTVRDALVTLTSAANQLAIAATAPPVDEAVSATLLNRGLDLAVDVASGAIQAHGGYGYLVEYPAEALFRDALSLRAAADPVAVRARTGLAIVEDDVRGS